MNAADKILEQIGNGMEKELIQSTPRSPEDVASELIQSLPRADALASGAMVQTSQAHDALLEAIERHEHMMRVARDTVAAKRGEADRINRELIDLCVQLEEHTKLGYEILRKAGAKLLEQGKAS